MFVNRENELKLLNKLYKSKKSELLVLYGRRRIGKTELLRQFSKDKENIIFFSSDLSSENEQLRQFTEVIYNTTKDSFLENNPFRNWESLLKYIFDHTSAYNHIVIIDEFPYLCNSNKALPSILQKVWDEKNKNCEIFLVLCGSYMSFMEKEVLSSKSPLFGRRTSQLHLKPLSYNNAKEFFQSYSTNENIYTYSILGGTPSYLIRFNEKYNIEENIKEEILNKNSFLYREPKFLLMEKLREPSIYFSILEAISFGKNRLNDIFQHTGIDRVKINKYISVLNELGIIKREIPVTEEIPYKSRKGYYTINDPYFRFWFRFVYPNFSYLEDSDVKYVWNQKIKPNLDSFTGLIYENICLQTIKMLNKDNKLPFKYDRIGRWWHKDNEIDILAYNKDAYLAIECKWKTKKIGSNILNELESKTRLLKPRNKIYYGFFSKSGFTDKLIEISKEKGNIILFNL